MLSDCAKWGVSDLLLFLLQAPVKKVKVNIRSADGLSFFLIGVTLGSLFFTFWRAFFFILFFRRALWFLVAHVLHFNSFVSLWFFGGPSHLSNANVILARGIGTWDKKSARGDSSDWVLGFGFGFWVLGFGFWVLSFWFRVFVTGFGFKFSRFEVRGSRSRG